MLAAVLVTAWLVGGATDPPNPRFVPDTGLAVAAPWTDRIQRVEQWLKAVLHHQPGSLDRALNEVSSWPDYDLARLKMDLQALVLLMRKPGSNLYLPSGPRPALQRNTVYTPAGERRLTELACAAGGIVLTDLYCVKQKARDHLDNDLRALAQAAAEGREVGADNYILKRGALLHGDIAMFHDSGLTAADFAPADPSPLTTSPLRYRQRREFQVEMSDGQATGVRGSSAHWGIARMLLDGVRPTRQHKPAPELDDMVRNWYYATAAWMQYHVHYNFDHLEHGVEVFPNDAGILFLAGAEHEIYADPYMQNVVRTVVLPAGSTIEILSEREELRKSEALFRRALVRNPRLVDAHLRLGHVLTLLGRPTEAQPELRQAVMSASSDMTRYFGEVFLARVEESLGELDVAAQGYQRASSLFPTAQSPLVAIAALARRRGDRRATLAATEKVFHLPQDDEEARDPWWIYYIAQDLNADDLIEALQRPFLTSGESNRQ